MIAAVDLHNEHQVYLYDNNGNAVFKEKGDTNKIHDVCWDAVPGSTRFATAGVKHIYFWESGTPGGNKKKGLFNGHEMTSFACVAWCDQGKCYTGGSNSKIYIWGGDDGRKCEATMDFHSKGFISALRFANGKLFSGGKDGKVNCIDTGSRTVTMCVEFPGLVRAVDFDKDMLLVGQRDGTITCAKDGVKTNIMCSHSDGEVWGLAQNSDGCIVTSGDDNKVMMWDPVARKHLKTVQVSERVKHVKRGASTLSRFPDSKCSRSVAINSEFIAVASNDGCVSIRTCAVPGTECKLLSEPKEWIEVMAFSPNNEYLAVGSHDNNIYVYSTSDWSLVGTCRAHNSYIMALDWCCASEYLRSNCGAYELLFFKVPSCDQDPSGRSNTTATQWATNTVTEGIYPSGTDGTHINSVAGSCDK
jgi:microtubule-associated protein-like 1/2